MLCVAAKSDDPLSQFLHARRVRTSAERVAWLQKSANSGFSRAQNELGWALTQGDGVRASPVSGKRWLQRAADANEPEAWYNLGLLAGQNGNIPEAVELFRRAAQYDVTPAKFNLAVSYYRGIGVDQNLDLAREWFEQAGDGRSLMLASEIVEAGTPTASADLPAALELRKRSCKSGHAPACASVATLLLETNGFHAAEPWLKAAARHGDADSQGRLDAEERKRKITVDSEL